MPVTATNAALTSSVEALYARLARHRPHGRIKISPLKDPRDIDQLHRKPLRALTADDLSVYAFSAVSTMGTETDFLYFLPRIVELLLQEGVVGAADFELLGHKVTASATDPGDLALIGDCYQQLFFDALRRGDDRAALEVLDGAAAFSTDSRLSTLVDKFRVPTSVAGAKLLVTCCSRLRPGRCDAPLPRCLLRDETLDGLTAAGTWMSDNRGQMDLIVATDAFIAAHGVAAPAR